MKHIKALLAAGVLLAVGTLPASAQWLTQTNVILPGWSAVFFYVDPSSQPILPTTANIPISAGNPIDQIWMWKYQAGTAQYISSPDSPLGGGGQWLTWNLTNSFSGNTLATITPNAAYLIHSTASTQYLWKVQGQPYPVHYTWDMTGLNFIGFQTPYANPPSFQNYLAQDPAISGIAQIYQYVGGPFSTNAPLNPAPVLAQYSTTVNRGQAYWVSATNVYNTYFGPFNVTLPSPTGLQYGTNVGQFTLQLVNVTTNTVTVYGTLKPSETPPSAEPAIVGVPPMLLEGAENTTNLTFAFTPVAQGVPQSWTLAPAGQPGSDIAVVLGVNRFALTNGASGSLYAGFLQFTDSLGFSEVDVPVSAVAANNAGLWVGSASISQVGSYLKKYATNANGTYQQQAVTNLVLSTNYLPTFPMTYQSISGSVDTNTTVYFYANTNWVVNTYTTNGLAIATNAYLPGTNVVIYSYPFTNLVIASTVTNVYVTNNGIVVYQSSFVTNLYGSISFVTNYLPFTTNVPILTTNLAMNGVYGLASTPAIGAGETQVVAVTNLLGDTRVALVAVGNSLCTVLTNNGGGVFTLSSAFSLGNNGATSVALGDVNNDGKPDLILASSGSSALLVFTNNGKAGFGDFTNITLAGTPTFVASADVNGDGKADVICCLGASGLAVLTNNGTGGLILATNISGTFPGPVIVTDVNGDSHPDLVAALGNTSVVVWTNNAKSPTVFVPEVTVSVSNPSSLAVGDVNHDGKPDVISLSGSGTLVTDTIMVLTNTSNLTFGFYESNHVQWVNSPNALAAQDVNGDGYLDVICCSAGNTLTVLTNNESGGLVLAGVPATGTSPIAVVAANVNGDGLVDLTSLNGGANTLSVYTNYSVSYGVVAITNNTPELVLNQITTNLISTNLVVTNGPYASPVTNLFVSTSVLSSSFVSTNAAYFLTFTNRVALSTTNGSFQNTNYWVTNISTLIVSAITNYVTTNSALALITNGPNLIVVNPQYYKYTATNTFQTNFYTNSFVISNNFVLTSGTNGLGVATNGPTSTTNQTVAVSKIGTELLKGTNLNLTLIVLTTNAAYTLVTNSLIASYSNYVVTAINTNLGPVVTPYPLRMIIFFDGTNASLLQRVYYGIRGVTNVVVATTQNVLDTGTLNVARRITSTSMPYQATNTPWAFTGQLMLGGTLTTTVTDTYDDQAANPFLHTYHPDHNNLNLSATPPTELPQGSQSYGISRAITLSVQPNTSDFISLTSANSSLSGIYQETTTLTGIGGATRTFTSAGTFTLTRLSPIATLTTQ